jgi:hypothetical protein
MSDFQDEMSRAVQAFVAAISELAHRAAVETLQSAFEADLGRAPGRTAAPSASPGAAPRVGRPPGGRGAKRTQEDLENISQQLVSYIKTNPGLRIEQINKALGTTTKDVALPLKKLIADNVITSKGQRRATTYSPGRKAAKY